MQETANTFPLLLHAYSPEYDGADDEGNIIRADGHLGCVSLQQWHCSFRTAVTNVALSVFIAITWTSLWTKTRQIVLLQCAIEHATCWDTVAHGGMMFPSATQRPSLYRSLGHYSTKKQSGWEVGTIHGSPGVDSLCDTYCDCDYDGNRAFIIKSASSQRLSLWMSYFTIHDADHACFSSSAAKPSSAVVSSSVMQDSSDPTYRMRRRPDSASAVA